VNWNGLVPLTWQPSVRMATDFAVWQRIGGPPDLYYRRSGASKESANLGDCTHNFFGGSGL
jgi:hypothetical protein